MVALHLVLQDRPLFVLSHIPPWGYTVSCFLSSLQHPCCEYDRKKLLPAIGHGLDSLHMPPPGRSLDILEHNFSIRSSWRKQETPARCHRHRHNIGMRQYCRGLGICKMCVTGPLCSLLGGFPGDTQSKPGRATATFASSALLRANAVS